MPAPLLVTFAAGASGTWQIVRMTPVMGAGLSFARCLSVSETPLQPPDDPAWVLRGTTSNTRYTKQREVRLMADQQQGLGRPQASHAALIPIRKSEAWWSMAQDERREVFEEQSKHIGIGMDYLPPIARRLHHCRDLGEPFDFLTWFEYAPEHADAFEELVQRLRETPEWRFVDREVDIRLVRT